jgi:hypothetical protein
MVRLSTLDLLIKEAHCVKNVNHVWNIKRSIRRSTVLILPLQKGFPALSTLSYVRQISKTSIFEEGISKYF